MLYSVVGLTAVQDGCSGCQTQVSVTVGGCIAAFACGSNTSVGPCQWLMCLQFALALLPALLLQRFPLMAARLAFIIAQDAMLSGSDQQSDRPAAGQSEPGPIGRLSSNSNASTSKWSSTNLGTISSRSSTNLHTSSWGSSAYSRTARVAGRADSLALSTKSCAGTFFKGSYECIGWDDLIVLDATTQHMSLPRLQCIM